MIKTLPWVHVIMEGESILGRSRFPVFSYEICGTFKNTFLTEHLRRLLDLQETADSVTFTEEILNGKLHLLCSVR